MYFDNPARSPRRAGNFADGLQIASLFNEHSGRRIEDISGRGNHGQLSEYIASSFTSPDTDSHQGYSTDGTYHYTIHTDRIYKRNNDGTWSINTSNTSPFASLLASTNHLGDGQVYNNKLYLVAETWVSCASFSNQQIAVFNTSDLSYNTSADISAQGHEVSGLTIDSAGGVIYVSSYCDPSKLWKYDLSTLGYIGVMDLPGKIPFIQGLYFKDGTIWVASDPAEGGAVYQIDLDGNILYQFRPAVGADYPLSIEGLDYSQSTLRVLVDYGVAENVEYFTPNYASNQWGGGGLTMDPAKEQGVEYNQTLPDSGSMLLRLKPNTFFNYNAIFDSTDNTTITTGLNWQAWIYATGEIAFRPNSVRLGYILPSATQTYDIAFVWQRAGGSINFFLYIDGVLVDSDTDTWVAPLSKFTLGSGHENNVVAGSDNTYYGFMLFDRVLTVDEIRHQHAHINEMFSRRTAKLSPAVFAVAAALSAAVESAGQAAQSSLAAIEQISSVVASSPSPTEFSQTVDRAGLSVFESLSSAVVVSNSATAVLEAIGALSAQIPGPFAVVQGLSMAAGGHYEVVGVVVVAGAAAVETMLAVQAGEPTIAEALQSVLATMSATYEAAGTGLAISYEELEMILTGEAVLAMEITDSHLVH